MGYDPLLCDPLDHDSDEPRSFLERVVPVLQSEVLPDIDIACLNRNFLKDAVNAALLVHLAPNHPELSAFDPLDRQSESASECDLAMPNSPREHEEAIANRVEGLIGETAVSQRDIGNPVRFDARTLKDQANAVLEHSAIIATQHATRKPVLQSQDDKASKDAFDNRAERRTRSGRSTPLRLHTQQPPPPPTNDETITTSPNLSKHVIPVAEGAPTTLPAMQSALPTRDGSATSPQTEKLPSLHQITGAMKDPLNAFAEVAALQDHRGQPHVQHHHSHSFGSATSQSPPMLYHNFPGTQTSPPPAPYALPAHSPPTTGPEHFYGSPPRHATSAYYADRRPSAAVETVPRLPPSLPSASSSGESQGHQSSTTDGGYSTAQTTPSELTQTEESTPRPMVLPAPSGMPVTGYKCDYDGCNAPLFQTQYLLSSHKNVHSDQRTHFCPYPECARGEGGKGFKRKNEMIRHQLVHKSPGYVCPFCPDREHKYPRPDNLLRHVRVHHVDKDRDDAQLCEVLAKRNGGAAKARRRRTMSGSAP